MDRHTLLPIQSQLILCLKYLSKPVCFGVWDLDGRCDLHDSTRVTKVAGKLYFWPVLLEGRFPPCISSDHSRCSQTRAGVCFRRRSLIWGWWYLDVWVVWGERFLWQQLRGCLNLHDLVWFSWQPRYRWYVYLWLYRQLRRCLILFCWCAGSVRLHGLLRYRWAWLTNLRLSLKYIKLL